MNRSFLVSCSKRLSTFCSADFKSYRRRSCSRNSEYFSEDVVACHVPS